MVARGIERGTKCVNETSRDRGVEKSEKGEKLVNKEVSQHWNLGAVSEGPPNYGCLSRSHIGGKMCLSFYMRFQALQNCRFYNVLCLFLG